MHDCRRLIAELEQQPGESALSAIQDQTKSRTEVRECTYHLFRNKQRPQLICAVADHRPMPAFLGPEQWLREGLLGPYAAAPPGFRERAAVTGMRLNGFYLFHRLRTGREHGQIRNTTRDRAA
jgi:hypothetical protein